MIYKISSQMLLENTNPDDNDFEFKDFQDALDCYRDGFKSIAENIADYGGEFTITMSQVTDTSATIIKRNTIATTINIM
jgi:hypothetical protein